MSTKVYADTSAVAKLFIAEKETPDLHRWLAELPEPLLLSSALLTVELVRLLRLINPVSVAIAEQFLSTDVGIVEITPPVLSDATAVPPPRLRTLDAIHLATALDLGDVIDVFLSYDKLLLEAARAAGLTVASPGVP